MPQTILIVEDTDLCRETLEVALMGVSDLSLQSVATAEEALRLLAGSGVSALITDLHLSSHLSSDFSPMDGFELIAAVRSLPHLAKLPILVISGDSAPHTAAKVEELGANAYFAKPYSPAAVRAKLEQLIHAAKNSIPLHT